MQLVWGWAEGGRCWAQGLWDAAVWSGFVEGRCGRLTAVGDGDGDDDLEEEDGCDDDDDAAARDWSIPNEAPPHLLRRK